MGGEFLHPLVRISYRVPVNHYILAITIGSRIVIVSMAPKRAREDATRWSITNMVNIMFARVN